MKVSIIIPNYNGKHLLEKNLPQTLKVAGDAQIIVVDDASTDGSADYIRTYFPKITLIEKMTNNGFATTVNLGAKAATGDVLFLLNTDTVPGVDCIPNLIKHFEDDQVFAVGCKDLSIENGKTVERGRGVGKFERGFLVHKKGDTDKKDTLWASGGSAAFRKIYWQKFGGMDELFDPFYWEDIDLSYRALKSGYRIKFEALAVVEHRHEDGSIAKQYTSRQIKQIAYRNQFIFVWKNITSKAYFIQHVFWLPYHFIATLIKGDFAFAYGFVLALIQLKQILKHNSQEIGAFTKSDEAVFAPFSHE